MLLACSIFSFVLMFIAWMMHDSQQRTIKSVEQHQEWPDQKREFLLSQVRRRKKVTFILTLIAAAVLATPALPRNIIFVIYWLPIIMLVLWLIVLAGIDGFAAKSYILSLRDQRIASRRALEEEAKRLRDANRSSTKPSDPPHED